MGPLTIEGKIVHRKPQTPTLGTVEGVVPSEGETLLAVLSFGELS